MKSSLAESSQTAALTAAADTAVVLVNYNGFDDVVRCVASLERLAGGVPHIVIVDNNSPDHSGARLKYHFGGTPYHVLCNPENTGYAGGNNVGIVFSRSLEVSYVWLLNPDTEVHSDALISLKRAVSGRDTVGAAGSKIFYAEQGRPTSTLWGCGGDVDCSSGRVSMRGSNEADRGLYDVRAECSYLPGCSLLARTEIFEQIGLLSEKYFMYFEETDWCMRVRNAGFRLEYVPESIVYHHTVDEKLQKPLVVYYYNRNERLFWMRYGSFRLKAKTWLRTAFRSLPQAYRATKGAQDEASRRLFESHLASCIDSLCFRSGRREFKI